MALQFQLKYSARLCTPHFSHLRLSKNKEPSSACLTTGVIPNSPQNKMIFFPTIEMPEVLPLSFPWFLVNSCVPSNCSVRSSRREHNGCQGCSCVAHPCGSKRAACARHSIGRLEIKWHGGYCSRLKFSRSMRGRDFILFFLQTEAKRAAPNTDLQVSSTSPRIQLHLSVASSLLSAKIYPNPPIVVDFWRRAVQ